MEHFLTLFRQPAFVPSSDAARARERRNTLLFMLAVTVFGALVALVPRTPDTLVGIGSIGVFGFAGMIGDLQTRLADAVALTATGIATNVYDSGAAGNDISVGEPLCVVITVDVAADFTTTDETYQFDVNESAAAALSTPTTLARRIIAASKLTAGSIHVIPIPPGSKILRYLGLNVTLGGTTPSITYTADLLPMSMIQANKIYADALTISS